MSERRTAASREEREWVEQMVERGDNVWAKFADRVGTEAAIEVWVVLQVGSPLWQVDLRRTPWAGNPELKMALLKARAATSALYEAVEKVVWDE